MDSIHAAHRDSGRSILRIAYVGGVQFSGDAMFRTENHIQRKTWHTRQNVNRPSSFRIEAGLIRKQSDPSRGTFFGRLQRRKGVVFEHINAGFYGSIPNGKLARRTLHFVVAGGRRQP